MAISWGPWEYNNGNGMRVGIEAEVPSVSNAQSQVTVTFRVYTQNQYSYNDGQTLVIGGTSAWGDVSYDNNNSTGAVRRTTKTFVHEYGEGENAYGSGDARTVTLTASVSGAYNGVTPSHSVTVGVPRKPYAAPSAPSNVNATRNSDSLGTITWTRNATAGRPYTDQRSSYWNNVDNSWSSEATRDGTDTTYQTTLSGNRRWRYRIRARNSAGYSGYAYSDYIQTTPAAPSSASATRASSTSSTIKWTNGASSLNGYEYDTLIEEQVNGGAWSQIATVGEGVTSYSRSGTPGNQYRYRVRARSTVGGTTYSSYSTTGTVQLEKPPAAPTNGGLSFNAAGLSAVLSWTNNPAADASIDSNVVQRWDQVTGTWNTVATLSATATSFTDTSLVNSRRYQWRVRANNVAGSSPWLNSAFAQTTPPTPGTITLKAATGGKMVATWAKPADNYPESHVRVRYYKDDVLVTDTVQLSTGTTSYEISGVTLTSTYKVGIKFVSTVGATTESPWVDSGTVPAATIPNAPTNLSPNGSPRDMAINQVFSWAHSPSADGSAQSSFEVQYAVNGGAYTSTGKLANGSVPYLINQSESWPTGWESNSVFGSMAAPQSYVSSTEQVRTGTSMKVTWATTSKAWVNTSKVGFIPEHTYTVGAWVYVPSGSSPVAINVAFGSVGAYSTKFDEWEYITHSFKAWATDQKHFVGVQAFSPTAGQVVYIDEFTVLDQANAAVDVSNWIVPAGTIPNNSTITWQVRTWGTHATASPWSAVASFNSSGTPTVTINSPSSDIALTSELSVDWSFADPESFPQSLWEVELRANADGSGGIIERYTGTGTGHVVAFSTPVIDGVSYQIRVRAVDSVGLTSGWATRTVIGQFVPPAESVLVADYAEGTGATVLTLTPTVPDGVTTIDAIGVDLEKRTLNRETGEWTPWVRMATGLAIDATLIDTTGPLARDGEYRAITHSAAPSSFIGEPVMPDPELQFMYVSYGPYFESICRMWANIQVKVTASRERATHHFAGRRKPVLFAGQPTTLTVNYSGVLDDVSSTESEWELLAKESEVVLVRDILGRRMYGTIGEISISKNDNGTQNIEFTVTEVDY